MLTISYATQQDKQEYFSIDKHLLASEYESKVRDRRCYIIRDNKNVIGVMRYILFWDCIPFLTLIYLNEAYRGKGYGKNAILFWEKEMRDSGFRMVMISTQVDEQAQHFYRKLGYIDKGSLFLDNTPIEQPQELLMIKVF
ncbi:MAG: GNAT family N-acetyltransferase [Clostridiales bacterium GWF2_38_85]|nr:MAG: GNAT family N-acetyltransferase [Clostridiales bacterium GWF2_38_85]HBL83563.1 GNAT family N-acetyltransferase [Clostridiales bacterium]